MTRRFAVFGAVLVALAVVYVLAWRTQPGAARTAGQTEGPQTVAVTSVTRSCPPPAPNTGAAHIAMIAMPAQNAAAKTGAGSGPGTTVTGSAMLSAVPATAAPATAAPAAKATATKAPATKAPAVKATSGTAGGQPVTVSVPGALTTVTAPAATGSGGTAIAAAGQMAEGFEAEQANASGMGVVSCTHPESDMWFVGTGAGDGASNIRLYLMNTGDLAATASVTIITDTGLQPGLNTGITVAPHQFVTESIAPLARGSAA